MTDKMREWPTAPFVSRLLLPIMTKILSKILLRYKTTQTPVSERELAKKKIRKNLSKKKNEFKKKEKLWKNRGVQCD